MRRDNRQVLTLDQLNQGTNFCRYCIKEVGALLHFCDDTCFSNYLQSIFKEDNNE